MGSGGHESVTHWGQELFSDTRRGAETGKHFEGDSNTVTTELFFINSIERRISVPASYTARHL